LAHPLFTSRWSHVIVATYAVPPGLLAPYLPGGGAGGGEGPVELDGWRRAPLMLDTGRPAAALSLVARQCTEVKIYGVRWPRISRYVSVSLQFCVKQGIQRGVVYVSEICTSRAVAWALRRGLNQPVVVAEIEDEVKQQMMLIGAEYRVVWPLPGAPAGPAPKRNGRRGPNGASVAGGADDRFTKYMVRAFGSKPTVHPAQGSIESWLTERPFVFGVDAKGSPLVYEVIHGAWGVYPMVETHVRIEFGAMFGREFAFLSEQAPAHTMLAVGGETAIFPRRRSVGVRWGVRRMR